MNPKLRDQAADRLFDVILSLEDREECYAFFEDLCTVAEIRALSQRLAVAEMLSDRKTYADISRETHASAATISRVNRALVYGADGYRTLLARLRNKENKGS